MNNNLISSFFIRTLLFFFKKEDGVFSNFHTNDFSSFQICFDLSDTKYIHFGDILFFLPLINLLSKNKTIFIKISGNQSNFINTFLMYKKKIKFTYDYLDNNNVVYIGSPYCLPKNIISRKYVGIGFFSNNYSLSYPLLIIKKLFSFMHIDVKEDVIINNFIFFKQFIRNKLNKKSNFNNTKNYFIVSPYIASGRFRDLFHFKQKKIIEHAKMNSNKNLVPIIIGSMRDHNITLNFEHINLKGKSIIEVIQIASKQNIMFGIGFDNFWMHFFDLIGKDYKVFFRGRFFKKNMLIHMNSINVSFIDDVRRKEYLNL